MSNGCDCALHKSPDCRDAWKVSFRFPDVKSFHEEQRKLARLPKCTYSNVSIYSTYKTIEEYRE
jgi:hypothetical protein